MFAVVMMFATSAAFAADSDALKAILKAKNYADAAQLLNASVGHSSDLLPAKNTAHT